MFYHLPNPIIYASLVRLCYFLMEHSVRKQCFMFYHFLTQFSCPQNKVKVNYWYTILSWNNNVLCFMFYHIFDLILHAYWPWLCYFWLNLLSWDNVLCFTIYLTRFSILLDIYFWGETLSCNNDLCFMYYHLPFEKVNSSCHKPEVRVGFWYNILSWNNVVCFTIYLTYASTPFNLLMKHSGMKQCFMFYVLPSTWANLLLPLDQVYIIFWWNLILWGNRHFILLQHPILYIKHMYFQG